MLPSELLETTWVNHSPRGEQNCLITAMVRGTGAHNWSMELQDLVRGVLGHDNIIAWNDSAGRTKAEVVAVARLVEIKLGLRSRETDSEVAAERITV